MKNNYNNLKEVKRDLKILRLERDISLAELEGLKSEVQNEFTPNNMLMYAIEGVKKYGIFFLIKKLLG